MHCSACWTSFWASQGFSHTNCHFLQKEYSMVTELSMLQVSKIAEQGVLDLISGNGAYARGNRGAAPFLRSRNTQTACRLTAVQENIVRPWLKHRTGTLIMLVGFANNPELCKHLSDLGTFGGYDNVLSAHKSNTGIKADDKMLIPAFLRFRTLLGDPKHLETLRKAGFSEEDLGEMQLSCQQVTIRVL